MSSGEAGPEIHPRRRAALAAHALREKLAAAGLLDAFPELRGDVDDGRAVVRLGTVDAAAALELARRIGARAGAGRRRGGSSEAGGSEDSS
jgi:hypothetical protein